MRTRAKSAGADSSGQWVEAGGLMKRLSRCGASETDAERGFMARMMGAVLPHADGPLGDIFILDCPENDKWLEVVFRSTCRL